MKIRLTGSAAGCDRLLVRLTQVVGVREVSDFYPNRAPSALGRVYVDLTEPAGPPVRDGGVRTDTGPVVCPGVPGGERR